LTAKKLRFTVIVVSSALFLIEIIALSPYVPAAVNGHAGFRRLYTAGYMARTGQGHSLCDYPTDRGLQNERVCRDDAQGVFDSPAYEALLFVPLSLLSYRVAYVAFFAVNLGLLGLSIRALRPSLEKLNNVWQWLPAAVFLCFFPVALVLVQGQDSIVLLTLMVASAVSFYRSRDINAGVFLGLTLFKFEFALLIALLFLLWRKWRIVAAFCATSAAVTVISLLLAGVAGLRSCARGLFSGSPPVAGEGMNIVGSASAMPNLWCLFHTLARSYVSMGKVDAVVAACLILLLAWAATRTANFALAILVAVLISSHGTIYDSVLLVIPIAMVLDARLAVTTGRSRLWSRNIASLLIIAPAALFVAGLSYCSLALFMLGLLMPLRFTSSDSLPMDLAG
jgi:glycosyl transferase family 87